MNSKVPNVIRRLAVLTNPARPLKPDVRKVIVSTAASMGIQTDWRTMQKPTPEYRGRESHQAGWDLLLACGGDGTVLRAAHLVRNSGTPILGVNAGHLGFLSSIGQDDLPQRLPAILQGHIRLEYRTALNLRVIRKGGIRKYWALNDVIMERASSSILHLSAQIGRVRFTEYHADGLIIATPTGSTAYNLSAGGPILSPESSVMTFTPICPHTLTNRSLVMDEAQALRFELTRPGDKGVIRVDGQTLTKFGYGTIIEITRSSVKVPLAFLPESDYYQVLTKSLQWNKLLP